MGVSRHRSGRIWIRPRGKPGLAMSHGTNENATWRALGAPRFFDIFGQ